MSQHQTRQPEFTGRHMLLVMVAFFGVIFTVNGLLAYYANASWTGLLARNGYVASQDYNKVLADARRQAGLGWHSRLAAGRDGVIFSIADAGDRPLAGLDVEATIGRPTHARDDVSVALQPLGPGVYRGAVALAPGLWTVRVDARNGSGDSYRRIFDLRIRGSE